MDKLVKDGFLFRIILLVIIISVLLKSISIVSFAADVPFVFQLEDNSYNSYTLVFGDGNTRDIIFPYYVVCAYAVFSDGNYIIIMCPYDMLVTNGDLKGIDRLQIHKNPNGTVSRIEYPSFYQLTGYSSSNSVNVDDTVYQIRSMKIDSGVVIGCPMLSYDSNYMTEATWGIGASILTGIKQARQGVTLENANINVDTSDIEQLITTGNSINQVTSENVLSIKETLVSNSSSQITFGDEEKSLMKSYKEWLILIGFCVSLLLSRTVLHQMGRNIRGRS